MMDTRTAVSGDIPTILVVDDEAATRGLVALTLRRAGLEVIAVESGRHALRVLGSYHVDLVISDLGMPEMNGIELVQEIRAEPAIRTIPFLLITGSGDNDSVVVGLEAGADDFLGKPIRLDELVARVRAHLRAHAAWSQVYQDDLLTRSEVVGSLSRLDLSTDPETAAFAIVSELASRTEATFVSVTEVSVDGRMTELSTYSSTRGVRRGGDLLSPELGGYLLGRMRDGPWVDAVGGAGIAEPSPSLQSAAPDLVASAPIQVAGNLVALLSLGARNDVRAKADQRGRLLAAVIDYAAVLEVLVGRVLAGGQSASATRQRLQDSLDRGAFSIVVQPIVDLGTGATVGYEALTRFDDGMRPDLRFSEAAAVGLGATYELAAVRRAVEESQALPASTFLSVNVSPATILESAATIRDLVRGAARPVVIEVTEHDRIDDYRALLAAVAELGPDVRLAVDDAGAGFASLRHILELKPAFTKLDISLVRDIDADDVRRSMVAGLEYFAIRTDCILLAEGVESAAEEETLRELGVNLAQGYRFGRPAPVATFTTTANG